MTTPADQTHGHDFHLTEQEIAAGLTISAVQDSAECDALDMHDGRLVITTEPVLAAAVFRYLTGKAGQLVQGATPSHVAMWHAVA